MIAMAVACNPKVLVADEPTTALDVTVQAGILEVLRDLRDRLGTSILIITHDLGVIADIADRVVVMYAGRVVERARWTSCSPIRSTTTPPGCCRRSPTPGPARRQPRLQEIPGLVPVLATSRTPARSPTAARPPTEQCRASAPPLEAVRRAPDHLARVLASLHHRHRTNQPGVEPMTPQPTPSRSTTW